MPGLNVTIDPLVTKTKPYPTSVAQLARQIGAKGMGDVAQALSILQKSTEDLHRLVRENSPTVRQVIVTDPNGDIVGQIGELPTTDGRILYGGQFIELYVGDVLGKRDPQDAPFYADSLGHVFIGKNGSIDVLDPYGATAAWLGTQFDTFPITGAANNGSGLIRLTVTGHSLSTGDTPRVLNVGGVRNATGQWTVTKIDANHVDLQNSVFDGTYTSGGTIDRILHVTGAVNNGSGKIRLTVTAHGYESGDQVSITSVGGVANATGQWIITVIDANHFDLRGSTFAGAYTSGGLCLRYGAGGQFQNISIGGSTFWNYKLRAFPDGTLKIKDALITLVGTGATITLDPTTGSISVVAASPGVSETLIDADGITISSNVASKSTIILDSADGSVVVKANSPATMETRIDTGGVTVFDQGGSTSGVLIANGSLILNSAVTQDAIDPSVFTLGAGPQLTLLNHEITIQNSFGTLVIDITDAGTILTKGAVDAFNLKVNGVLIIDDHQKAKNLAEVDSVVYKVGGTTGFAFLGTVLQDMTFSTRSDAVFGTPGAGQSNGTVLTGIATRDDLGLTFNSGILTNAV